MSDIFTEILNNLGDKNDPRNSFRAALADMADALTYQQGVHVDDGQSAQLPTQEAIPNAPNVHDHAKEREDAPNVLAQSYHR